MSDQMLELCDAFARTGRNGNAYQVAYVANVKLLLFAGHDPQPDRPTHTLFVPPRRLGGISALPRPTGPGQACSPALARWRSRSGATEEGARPDQRLRETIELAALRRGKLDARALSYWLRAHRDVRVGTMTLRRADGSHGGIARWKVVT